MKLGLSNDGFQSGSIGILSGMNGRGNNILFRRSEFTPFYLVIQHN